MKAVIHTASVLRTALICIVVLVCGIIALVYGIRLSWFCREFNYYRDASHFVEVTGAVCHIHWGDEETVFAIDTVPEGFSDPNFIIEYGNYETVMDNGLKEQLQLGDTITFIAAPRYFGDGYIVPIAEISIDGEVYLEFETGYQQLMDQYWPLS